MKVLYDFQAFNMQRFGGISNCFVQLMSHLPNDIEAMVGLKGSSNIHLKNSKLYPHDRRIYLPENCNWMGNYIYQKLQWHCKKLFPTPENSNMDYSIRLMNEGNYDILHPTYFHSYFLEHNTKPFVVTIHDMIPEIYNFDDNQVRGKQEQINKATHIIAVSENTKNDIVKILGINPDKVTVIYHGYTPKNMNNNGKPLIEAPYILFVGTRWFYKKFDYFLQQVKSFIDKHSDYKIVCTGSKFRDDEMELIQSLGLKNKVIQRFCTDWEIENLYQHAFAFVFPSEYEGFGIPILEAFSARCPTILNNKSCFPEIAQDGALYFDSDDDGSTLHMRLEELYAMTDSERKKLLARATKRLLDFSWKKSAEKLAEVYRKVYNEHYV